MGSNSNSYNLDRFDSLIQPTGTEFMSVNERLGRINQRIQQAKNKGNCMDSKPAPRCSLIHFTIDAAHVTEARNLISSVCKDKLIYVRVKPIMHASVMQVEVFADTSVILRVKEMMKSSFQCCRSYGIESRIV